MSSYKDEKTNTWYCQFYYTDWTGARKHTSKHGFARKKDSEQYEKDFKDRFKQRKASMAALLEEYDKHLDNRVKLGNLKEDTANLKRGRIMQHIEPFFKDVKDVSTLTAAHINNWLAGDIQSLGIGTARNIRSDLNQILNYAMRNGYIETNPLSVAEPLKNESRSNKNTKVWSVEQYNVFYNSLPSLPYKAFFDVLFWAGLRIGEAAALTSQDIHPYYITVRRTFKDDKYGGHFNTPKTDDSIRDVQIPHFLYYWLKHYIEHLYIEPNERIFPMRPAQMRFYMHYYIPKLGLPPATPHTLRHSYASLLLHLTKDLAVVASQIGHSDIRTTSSTYAHMLPDKDRSAVDALEAAMFPPETIDLETEK